MRKFLLYSIIAFMGYQAASCGILNKKDNNKMVATPVVKVEPENIDDSIDVQEVNAPMQSKIDSHIGGEWTLVSLFGKKITLDELPFINFNIAEGKIYGNTGCNVINGSFTTGKEKELVFGDMISTMMSCPNSKVETSFLKALNETTHYSYSTIKGFNHLNLIDKRGAQIMTLKRHNLDGLNGAWTVQEIAGVHTEDEKVKLVIDIQELKIHGNSGCNIINGQVVLDPKKDRSVQFAQIASTRMACPDMKTETALLVALEEVEFYKKKTPNEIEFYNNKGVKVLILKRLDLNK